MPQIYAPHIISRSAKKFADSHPIVAIILGVSTPIFAIFYLPYGMKYGWLTPLWYFPLMLLVVLAGLAIKVVAGAVTRAICRS